MKNAVVYFSHTGNNRLLAEHLGKRLDCDVLPVVEAKRRTGLTMLLDIAFKRETKILPLERRLDQYSHVIFVAPIWAFRIANPMRSLLKREKSQIREYTFVTFCGYERPKQNTDVANDLLRLIGRKPRGVVEFRISDLFPQEKRNDVRLISQYQASEGDLTKYEKQIAEVVTMMSQERKVDAPVAHHS